MKIKNIIITAAVAASMGMGTASCDYLDVVPVETPSVDNTMDNYTQALGSLYVCYRGITQPMASDWRQGFNTTYGQPLPGNILNDFTTSTDEWMLDDVQMNQAPLARALYANSISSSNNLNDYKIYSIRLANVFLFLEKLDQLGIPRGIVSIEEANQWKAECKFMIAYYHYCLLRRFGPIAIVPERLPMNTAISQFPGRMHYDYCVDEICKWLDEAAEVLPARRSGSETGRATSTICKALKARILLYAASPLFNGKFPFPAWKNKVETPGYGYELVSKEYDREKWVRAAKASEEALALAIGDGQRSLYEGGSAEQGAMVRASDFPVDNIDENFIRKVLVMRNVICAKESEGNHEHIWTCVDLTAGTASMYRYRIPHNVVPKSSSLPEGYIYGYNNIGVTLPFSNKFLTVNGLQPTNDPDFTKEADWFKSAGYSDQGTHLRSHIIRLFANREPRFYAWLMFDGGTAGTLLYNGERPAYINYLSRTDQGYTSATPRDYCPTGIGNQKWLDPKANVTLLGKENFFYAPRPMIRLAELYLNLAECYAELGETTKALDNINIIRRRAGATELTADMVTRSGQSLVEWARNERSVELFDEMHRYFDIRRWCQGEVIANGKRTGLNAHVENPTFAEFNKVTPVNSSHVYQWADRMYLYPIDAEELYSNPQFVQSPGY